MSAAERRIERRRAAMPAISYPPDLPVSQRRQDLLEAIRDSQVVVVAGETGSGKTTQLPKICLELGRGVQGTIGHTQPRRIAARSVAERIAEELDTEVGDAVGYAVRFTDRVSDRTLVKVMTDGILLAEIQRDRLLRQYDTLIIDEAHERSLNIDFLLGYLAQLLPRRPDLRLIITSATIDPHALARHFGGAPVIEVSGRTYPVEIRYRPLEESDQVTAICDAVLELAGEGSGDVLVFLSGEREIRDTAEALAGCLPQRTEVLPLYARLSAAEQHRVFRPHPGRRIVLATNVAETSLTVPGIRYVVDPGTARISRYSNRTKVQRLPIEPVSQASARQRAGRCGRVADGICIRLYSEEDYEARPAFTEPEMLRTNLASVILQMAALGLGEVQDFGFLDPPDRRQVKDGVQLLQEIGALDPDQPDPRRRLTPIGRSIARLPVDPRLARMVLEAAHNGCLDEVLVIAAALSIQDPRERPADRQQAADQMHGRFTDKTSDFLTFLNLWTYVSEQQDALSSSAFRRMCNAEFLHFLRIREWQDLSSQLRRVARTLDLADPRAGGADLPTRIHTSLLAGLLSHIGVRDVVAPAPSRRGATTTTPSRGAQEYLGARGTRFAIFPGSALFRSPPRWVMATELVETSRLWARIVARIEPEWIEALAGHLARRTYSEPHWEKDRGAVMAVEKVLLYGVPIVASRTVGYAAVDPELSRELFIRHALVEGDWRTHHAFFAANRALLEQVEELEHRARRRDILVDDEALFDFYDRRLPPDVVSGRHFDAWWKRRRRKDPHLLTFSPQMLVNPEAEDVSDAEFPDTWRSEGLELPLSYQFEPGTAADGVTVHIPLQVLNQVTPEPFRWQVPGLREELVTALIRSLPKQLRVNLVPAPDRARDVLQRISPSDGPLLEVLGRGLGALGGVPIPRDAWQLDRVPAHLRMTFQVVDPAGGVLAEDTDLAALQQRLAGDVRAELAAVTGLERTGLRDWTIGTLPREVRQAPDAGSAHDLQGYPALVDDGDAVAVHVLGTPAQQQRAMQGGTRRLLMLTVPSPGRAIAAALSGRDKLALASAPHAGPIELLEDCTACAIDALVTEAGGPAWDTDGFERLRAVVRDRLATTLEDVVALVVRILDRARTVDGEVRSTSSLPLVAALTDIRAQLDDLVHPGFVAATGRQRLPDLDRYLQGIERRLQRLPENPNRDRTLMSRVHAVQDRYEETLARHPDGDVPPDLQQVRWMIEEFRVSLFAQPLKTAYPVSEQRIERALAGSG